MKRIKTAILKIKPTATLSRLSDIKIFDVVYNEELEIFKLDVYSSKDTTQDKIILKKLNYITTVWPDEALSNYDKLLDAYLEHYDYVPDGCELSLEGFDECFDTSSEVEKNPKNITAELPRKLAI